MASYIAVLLLPRYGITTITPTPEPAMEYASLLEFWFHDQHQPLWFSRNDDFDAQCKHRFYPLWQAACRGELFHWRGTPHGRLAEIVLLINSRAT